MTIVEPINVPVPVKLTIEQFDLLDRSGAFDGYAKTELIDGAIYAMQGQFQLHAYAKTELGYRLRNALKALQSPLYPLVAATVGMPPFSAPAPDISLTTALSGEGYVPLETVRLAIEIADSTAAFDLGLKAALYAKHGVAEYWVVEIPAALVHQFWSPDESGYREGRRIGIGKRLESATITGLAVETEGLI